jgi:hypothetical protein
VRNYAAAPVAFRERRSCVELGEQDIVEEAASKPVPPALVAIDRFLSLPRTTWQAADVCASALVKGLGARAVLIHERCHDGTFRIIGVHGLRTHDLLGANEAGAHDLVVTTLRTTEQAVIFPIRSKLPPSAPNRFSVVGATHAVLVIPVHSLTGVVGMIEVFDPNERGGTFELCRQIANRLGRYLSQRKVAA